jgi:hypothetical protein
VQTGVKFAGFCSPVVFVFFGQQGSQLIKFGDGQMSKVGFLAEHGALRIAHSDPPTAFIVLDGVLVTPGRRTFQNGISVEAEHHRAFPLLLAAIATWCESLFVKIVGHERAVERPLKQPCSGTDNLADGFVLDPIRKSLRSLGLDVPRNRAGHGGALLLKAIHQLVFETPGSLSIVFDVLFTSLQHIFLPRIFGRIDEVVGRQHARPIVNGNSTKAMSCRAAHEASDVFEDQQIKLARADLFFDLDKLWPIKSLALPLRCNNPVFNRSFIMLPGNLFAVVYLIVDTDLLLVLATADSSYDAHNQGMAISRI